MVKLVRNLYSDMTALRANSISILIVYNLIIGFYKKKRENYTEMMLLNKRKCLKPVPLVMDR